MSHTSDTGSDRTDLADISRQYGFNRELAAARAPISYRMIYIVDGQETTTTFECCSSERTAKMRELGVNPDNDRFAFQSKSTRGIWGPPVGDKELAAKLPRR
jgi:hypothetical protein